MDLLVPVLEDGSEPRQQILYRGSHLGHTNLNHDALEGSENAPEYFRVLLTKALVEIEPKPSETSFFPADPHRVSDLGDQVSCLLPNAYILVVEPPVDCPYDLHEVGLGSEAQGVYDSSEAVEDD